MLKRAAALLAAILMLTTAVFAVDGGAVGYAEPTEEEKAAMDKALSYAFLLSDFGGDVLPSDGGIVSYLLWHGEFWEGGSLYEYRTDKDYLMEYIIPYDWFISTVDKYFAVHSDMKEYFGEDYDKDANTVYIVFGGEGGYGINMYPECFLRVRDTNEYHVLGVELDIYFDKTLTDEMKPHVDYFPQIFDDGSMQPCYVNGCFDITFVKDGGNFRMSGIKSIDYYPADGKVYLRDGRDLAGIYDSLAIETNGTWFSCEQVREFGYNLYGLWIPESTEITFRLKTDDGLEIESVTYNDGTERTLTPTDGGIYKVTTGESAAALTVKTKAVGTEPPVETDAETEPPVTETSAPETETEAPEPETEAPEPETETAAPETGTAAPETETAAPETDAVTTDAATDAVSDDVSGASTTDSAAEGKGGCGSVMNVSAVTAAVFAAVLAVSKRRH